MALRRLTNKERIHEFMRGLGAAVRGPGRVYFTGGVSAVLMGWRETTVDIDLAADPEPAGFFEALPALKERLALNVELARPPDFIPELPGWRERSPSIGRQGAVEFFHFDFYSQALAKMERDHHRDRHDVARMIEARVVLKPHLQELFQQIEPVLIRYPAIDAVAFADRVAAL